MNWDYLGYVYIFGIIFGPATLLTLVSYLATRKKVKWHKLQLLTLILPFIFHIFVGTIGNKFYGMGGYLNEVFILSCSIGIFVVLSTFFCWNNFERKPMIDLLVSLLLVLLFNIFFPESISL